MVVVIIYNYNDNITMCSTIEMTLVTGEVIWSTVFAVTSTVNDQLEVFTTTIVFKVLTGF